MMSRIWCSAPNEQWRRGQISSHRSQLECWNTGTMETGNPLVADDACGAGVSGAQRARKILGQRMELFRFLVVDSQHIFKNNDPIQPTPLFQYSTIPSFQRNGYWQSRSAGGGLTWPKGPGFRCRNKYYYSQLVVQFPTRLIRMAGRGLVGCRPLDTGLNNIAPSFRFKVPDLSGPIHKYAGIRPPMHSAQQRCSSVKYSRYSPSSRLTGQTV